MIPEAQATYRDTFERCLKVCGPRDSVTEDSLRCLYRLYQSQDRTIDARQLKAKAERLGCDVSGLV